jgi:hypothetical protein
MKRFLFISYCFLMLCSACGNSGNNPTTEVKYTIKCNDTLFFDTNTEQQLPVTIKRITGASAGNFTLKVENFSTNKYVPGITNLACGVDQTKTLSVRRDTIQKFEPGIYTCKLSVVQNEVNTNSSNKTIYLVSKPSCAFNFNGFANCKSVDAMGITTYKNVTCTFKSDNSLDVEGARPYIMNLSLDCATNKITVKPLNYAGIIMAGEGVFTNNAMFFNATEDGVTAAVLTLQP